MNKRPRFVGGALVAVALFAGAARAGVSSGSTTALFDFEGQPVSTSNLTTLTVTNSGLSATIDRAGQAFGIVDLSAQSGASAFGARTLSPTPPGNTFFNVNFSQAVSSFSAQMGDFGSGTTDSLAITAFTGPNGTGTNLGTTSASLPLLDATTLASKTLQINAPNIMSVELIGGSTASANSVFYDNFGVTVGGTSAVPLPSALYTAPLGAMIALYGMRRMRRGVVS